VSVHNAQVIIEKPNGVVPKNTEYVFPFKIIPPDYGNTVVTISPNLTESPLGTGKVTEIDLDANKFREFEEVKVSNSISLLVQNELSGAIFSFDKTSNSIVQVGTGTPTESLFLNQGIVGDVIVGESSMKLRLAYDRALGNGYIYKKKIPEIYDKLSSIRIVEAEYALQFNGNGYVSIVNGATDFNSTNEITFDFWMKTSDPRNLVVAETNLATNGFYFILSAGGAAGSITFGYSLNMSDRAISKSVISNGQYHHIVATFNRTTKEMNLYIDGNLEATKIGSTTPPTTYKDLVIGSRYGSAGIIGMIDDFKVFNYRKSSSEIQRDHQFKEPIKNSDLRLLGYWKFDEGTGSIAVDSSTKGRNGTITLATWVDAEITFNS